MVGCAARAHFGGGGGAEGGYIFMVHRLFAVDIQLQMFAWLFIQIIWRKLSSKEIGRGFVVVHVVCLSLSHPFPASFHPAPLLPVPRTCSFGLALALFPGVSSSS